MRRALLLLLIAAAGAPATASAALETVIQDDALLIHRPTAQVRAHMARIDSLGIDRVRLTANWAVLTRDGDAGKPPRGFDARDPGAYEQVRWRGLDQAVALARRRGLEVLVDIGFWAPRWATTAPPGPRARTNIDGGHYADFAVAVARRYSGRFVPPAETPGDPAPAPAPEQDEPLLPALQGEQEPVATPPPPAPGVPLDRVDQFALWNEPNHPALLLPQFRGRGARVRPASPGVYRRMVRAAYPAAKSERPDARFLIGNTSSIGSLGNVKTYGAVAPLRFLRELACVDRALRPRRTPECRGFTRIPGDGWAHHPYNRNQRPDARSPEFAPDDALLGDLDRLSALLRRLIARDRVSPGLRRIHLTEFGYETARIGGRPKVPPRRQARWLTWAEYVATRTPGVVSFAQFLLRDQPPAPVRVSDSRSRPFGQFFTGLLTTEGKAKPAARSYVAGLHAEPRPRGRVLLWMRLRLGDGPREVGIQRRLPGRRWARLLTVRADGQAAVSRTVVHRSGAAYRLVRAGRGGRPVAGLAVRPRSSG